MNKSPDTALAQIVSRRAAIVALGTSGALVGGGCRHDSPTTGSVAEELLGAGNVAFVDTDAELYFVIPAATSFVFMRGFHASGDGGGGLFHADNATSVWRRFAPRHLNVKWFGARGDGSTNDTLALQAALDASSNVNSPTAGIPVYLPPGTYVVHEPLRIVRSSSTTPLIARIFGAGPTSKIKATNTTAFVAGLPPAPKRALIELIGDLNTPPNGDNGFAIQFHMSDLLIDSSQTGEAYCLRLGNSRSTLVERIRMIGRNGLILDCGTPGRAAYAQIDTVFRSCHIQASVNGLAVDYQGGGVSAPASFWDNVRFESCSFVGKVLVRPVILEFEECTFESAPALSANSVCVELNCYSATFVGCTFRRHTIGIKIVPPGTSTRCVTVRDSTFLPTDSMTSGALPTHAIKSEPSAANAVGRLVISNTTFAVSSYSAAVIGDGDVNTKTTSILVDNGRDSAAALPVTISPAGVPPGPLAGVPLRVYARSQRLRGKAVPEYVDRARWAGTFGPALPSVTGRISNLSSLTIAVAARRAWVSKIAISLEVPPALNLGVVVVRNGVDLGTLTVTSGLTAIGTSTFVFLEPWPNIVINANDRLGVRMVNASQQGTTLFVVEIELGA